MPIRNLTPHPIALFTQDTTPADLFLDGRGLYRSHKGYTEWRPEPTQARVSEERSDVSWLEYPDLVDYQGPGELPGGGIIAPCRVPVRTVKHGAITGLPAPEDGQLLIVSLPVVSAARAAGRQTSDLLTPGDLVRGPNGEIAGVTSFYRW